MKDTSASTKALYDSERLFVLARGYSDTGTPSADYLSIFSALYVLPQNPNVALNLINSMIDIAPLKLHNEHQQAACLETTKSAANFDRTGAKQQINANATNLPRSRFRKNGSRLAVPRIVDSDS